MTTDRGWLVPFLGVYAQERHNAPPIRGHWGQAGRRNSTTRKRFATNAASV